MMFPWQVFILAWRKSVECMCAWEINQQRPHTLDLLFSLSDLHALEPPPQISSVTQPWFRVCNRLPLGMTFPWHQSQPAQMTYPADPLPARGRKAAGSFQSLPTWRREGTDHFRNLNIEHEAWHFRFTVSSPNTQHQWVCSKFKK